MKARAGVTLVELLVVILIVTILSVSMLPLLQPFVVEAQYTAEAIPVIGNLRTKIGLYQYDKAHLPYYTDDTSVETWKVSSSDSEKFDFASYTMNGTGGASVSQITAANNLASHVGMQCDVDYEDLKGKRSKPSHYQYYAISPSNNYAYVIACFGDGNGLKAGTGYAVCELNFTGAQKKYIGTWKRYKPTKDDAGALQFGSTQPTDASKKLDYCYVPAASAWTAIVTSAENGVGEPGVITKMKQAGWEF